MVYRTNANRGARAAQLLRETSRRDDDLVALTSEIHEVAGAAGPLLVSLIERRAANISAIDSARFILAEWKKDDAARDRLLTHAKKTNDELQVEREVAHLIRTALAPFTSAPFTKETCRAMVKVLSKIIRRTAPWIVRADADMLATLAVELQDDKIVIRTDDVARALSKKPRASAGAH